MAIPLRQSTAGQEIPLGYFVDSTDGDTEETGLTISNTDIFIWKHGATTLANPAAGATHISNGIFYFVADATDSNTLGGMVIYVHESGALTVKQECLVHPANVFDALYSTDKLEVDATLIEGGDATDAINAACDAAFATYDPPTKAEMDTAHALLATEAKQDVIDGIVDDILAYTIFDYRHTRNKLIGTDNGDGTITYVLYADDGSTPLLTWVYTTASGTRAAGT